MSTTVQFDYSIGDLVLITSIGMRGVVDALSADINGKQYRVVYWNDSQRYSQYLYDWEIEAFKGKQ